MIITTTYIGSGTREDPFRPEGSDEVANWGSVDLRDDPTSVEGECLFQTHDEAMARRSSLSKEEAADIACERLLHKIQPSRGVKEIWLGGELIYSEPKAAEPKAEPIDPSDDFNRANGSLGANWDATGGAGLVSIVSQQLAGDPTWSWAQHMTQAATDDQFAQFVCTATSLPAGSSLQVGVRAGNLMATKDWYAATTDSGTPSVRALYKYVGGSYTSLTYSTAQPYTQGQVMRIEAQGSTIRRFFDGALFDSLTDTSLSGANNRRFFVSISNTSGVPCADDFVAGDIGAAPADQPAIKRFGGIPHMRQGQTSIW